MPCICLAKTFEFTNVARSMHSRTLVFMKNEILYRKLVAVFASSRKRIILSVLAYTDALCLLGKNV